MIYTPDSVIQKIDDTDCKEIEDKGIILNLNNGDYFSVNKVSLFIWKSLNGRNRLAGIAKKVAANFNVDDETALKDLLDFVRRLDKLKLVKTIL